MIRYFTKKITNILQKKVFGIIVDRHLNYKRRLLKLEIIETLRITAKQMTVVKSDSSITMVDEEDRYKISDCKEVQPHTAALGTNLTDINIDCLEGIFNNLDLINLLSVCDSNKYVKRAAELIFVRRYGKKKVWLDLFIHCPASPVTEQLNQIKICGLRTCLKVLRCFGHLIANLHVTGDRFVLCGIKKDTNRLMDYVSQFGNKNLKEITFEKLNEASLLHIKDEFATVETVRYKQCEVKGAFIAINQIFPKMRSLELLWTDLTHADVFMPNLERLLIDLPIYLNTSQKQRIETMIQLNPQLKCLKLYFFFWNSTFLRSISKHFKSIENLDVSFDFIESDTYNVEQIHMNGVKKFHIQSIAVPRIVFSFDQLEEFTLETNCRWTENNINLIKKHTAITKLVMKQMDSRFRFNVNDEIAMEMASELPKLKQLIINYKEISVREAICVLKQFKALDRIQFNMEHRTDFNELTRTFIGKWTSKVLKDNSVEFERI